MTREHLMNKIELKRLGKDETYDVLMTVLENFEFPEDFKQGLYRETEGNPLFIIEVIKLLVAEKLISEENGIWKLNAEEKQIKIPSKVYDVIVSRLGRLSAGERRILDYASVVGDEFDPILLAEVMRIMKVELLERLRDLEQNHKLIRFSQDVCRFDHAKVKEVLYTEIPSMLRKEYHSLVAGCIEDRRKEDVDKIIGDLAYHYYRGGSSEKGLKYLSEAAETARKNYAIQEALKFYCEALDLIGEDGYLKERLNILSNLGDLSRIAGELDTCMEYYVRLLKLSEEAMDDSRRIEAYHNIGLVHKRRNEWDDAIGNLENSLEIAKEVNDLQRVADNYYDMGYVYERKGDYDRALDCFGHALENAVNADASFLIARAYRAFGSLSDLKGDHDGAISHFKKSLEILENTDNLYEIARVYIDLGITSFLNHDLDKSIEYNEKSIEISKKIGDIRSLGYALLNAAEAYSEKHKFEKAIDHLDRAMEIFQKLDERMMIAAAHRDYGIVYKLKNDWNKSITSFTEAVDIYENQIKVPYYQAYTYFHFGLMFKERGDNQEATRHLNRALEMYDRLEMKKDSEKVKKEIDGL
jgi:tetratricopeptide (TPR) repeat protein